MNDPGDLLSALRIERTAPEAAPRRSRALLVLLGVVLLSIGIGAWWMQRSDPPLVRTAIARPAAAAALAGSVLDASGYVTARRQATVSAKVTGKVAEVLIEEGMRVEEGQLLARLDATDAQAQQALAQAQLAAAQGQLGEIEANLALARSELARHESLRERGLGTGAQLDTARAQRNALAARLESARSQVEVARRSLALSQIAIDNTVIRAPFAGVVVAKAAQPGEMISPISAGGGFTRTGIGTIVDMDSLEVQVDVSEAFIGRVAPGQPVQAVLNAYPDWRIPAHVIAIVPTADRSKATVKVRIALDDTDPRIVPEMGVRVAFLAADAPAPVAAPPLPGVLVPVEALVERRGAQATLYVVDGESQVARRSVQLAGEPTGGLQRVTSGIQAGARGVIDPPEGLADGTLVQAGSP